MREEAPVVARRGQQWPIPVEAGFGIVEDAVAHAERSQRAFMDELRYGRSRPTLEVSLEEDETFARVAPALPGRTERTERFSFGPPVRQPGRVRQHVTNGDAVGDDLVEIVEDVEGDVGHDLLHERRCLHDLVAALGVGQLPLPNNGHRSTHAPQPTARQIRGTRATASAKDLATSPPSCWLRQSFRVVVSRQPRLRDEQSVRCDD